MLNKAILIYSLKRLVTLKFLLTTCLLASCAGLLSTGLFIVSPTVEVAEGLKSLLFSPFVPMVVAFLVVVPQVANYKQTKDGEYLSLIFSRPVSRYSYVLTKWLAGSLTVLFFCSVLLVFVTLPLLFLHPEKIGMFLDGYVVTDCILNAFGYTALAVCLGAFPMQIGLWLFMILVYSSMIFGLSTGLISLAVVGSDWGWDNAFRYFVAFVQFMYSFFVVSVDSYHLINSSQQTASGIASYFSNLVLYLTAATLLMSQREFFYAND